MWRPGWGEVGSDRATGIRYKSPMHELLRLWLGLAVFVLMLSVGMDCTGGGFRRTAARPLLLVVATLVQYVCIPALMLAVVFLLRIPPGVATALILVSACPSGTISNAYTFLSRGNTSLSVALTAISNLVALAATPLAVAAAAALAGAEIASSLAFPPGALLRQLLFAMLLPLGLGFALRRRFEGWVIGNLKRIRAICLVLIVSVVTLSVLMKPAEIAGHMRDLAAPVLIITPVLFAVALAVSRAFGLGAGDRRAILFELPCRNVALAMLISMTVLGRPELAFVAVAFFILESILLLGMAAVIVRADRSRRARAA